MDRLFNLQSPARRGSAMAMTIELPALQQADAKQSSENPTDVVAMAGPSEASWNSASQVSSGISVPNTRFAPQRARRLLVAGLVALAVVACIVAFGVGRSAGQKNLPIVAASAVPAPEMAPAPSAATELGPRSGPAPGLPSAADSTVTPAPTSILRPPAPARHRGGGPASLPSAIPIASSAAAPNAASADCDPPYTLDQHGVKTFKLRCL